MSDSNFSAGSIGLTGATFLIWVSRKIKKDEELSTHYENWKNR